MTDHDGDGRATTRSSGPAASAATGERRDQAGAVADPHHVDEYVEDEKRSTLIRSYEPSRFPGLLQVEGMVRAMAETYRQQDTAEQRARFVRTRLERAKLLEGPDAPQFSVLINEKVLRRELASPQVRRAQLEALALELEGGRSNVEVRIVPASLELPAGPRADAFVVMSLRQGHDVLWRESEDDSERVDAEEDVKQAVRSFEQLARDAYGTAKAWNLIKEIQDSLG